MWHRGHSHRGPNRSQSPKRRLEKHADVSHLTPTSQDFSRELCGTFLLNSEQPKGFRIASDKIFSHRYLEDLFPENPYPKFGGVKISPPKFGERAPENTVKQVFSGDSPPKFGGCGFSGFFFGDNEVPGVYRDTFLTLLGHSRAPF